MPVAAVRFDLVVVDSPFTNCLVDFSQRLKLVRIEAFVAEGAVEALNVRVVVLAARLDQNVFDAVLFRTFLK